MLSTAARRAKRASPRSRSIPTLCRLHPRVPLRSQIDPVRIPPYYQPDFLRPPPPLELSLTRKSSMHIVIRLPIKQSGHVVLISEPFEVMKFVLKHATVEIAAEAYVQRTGQAPHNVYAIVFRVSRHDPTSSCHFIE